MRIFDECGEEKFVMDANKFFDTYFVIEDTGKKGIKGFFKVLKEGSLDGIGFKCADISDRAFWLGDGGDMFMLKDKTIMNVCWRWGRCHIWRETNPNSKVKKFFGLYNNKK